MLSYQHLYHAGCAADVHKHAVLAAIIEHLVRKDKALTYLETHAARGLYDLNTAEALKTAEAQNGINRITATALKTYCPALHTVLEHVHKTYGSSHYPGSPAIARHFLRDRDMIHLCELHPQEFAALNTIMTDKNIRLYHRDGYETALSLCPPTPRRGIVLIDPSFELKDEYDYVSRFIPTLLTKWPEATVMLWYPILAENRHEPMINALQSYCTGMRPWRHEILFNSIKGMDGSGLFVVNMPYGITLPDINALFG